MNGKMKRIKTRLKFTDDEKSEDIKKFRKRLGALGKNTGELQPAEHQVT